MYRKFVYSLTLVIVIMISASANAFAATTDSITKLFVNGKRVTIDFQIIDGRAYIPLRDVAEKLGADVSWDTSSRSIFITGKDYVPEQPNANMPKSDSTFAATDNITKLFVNGKRVITDLQIIDGNSYIPLPDVPEKLGANVSWDLSSRSVFIVGKDYVPELANADMPKSYDTDIHVSSGPMNLTISKVTLDPIYTKGNYSERIKVIIMDVMIENTSSDKVKWYVNQGKLVLNTKEKIPSGIRYSDLGTGGEFLGKELKKGKVVFQADRKSNLSDITSMTLYIHGASNENYVNVGEDTTTQIILN